MAPKAEPTTSASATTKAPTATEVWVPRITREKMSRPRLSEPRKCGHSPPAKTGGMKRFLMICSVGSAGSSQGAKIATMTMTAMQTKPVIPLGLARSS